MIPLDNYEKWAPLMEESAKKFLNEEEFKEFMLISKDERRRYLQNILEKPISEFTIINEVYFRARWAQVMKMLHPGTDFKLLEVASGDADMIPQVMAHTHPNSSYITANMNKSLTKSLLEKTKNISLKIEVIEDDAMKIDKYIGCEVVDVIAFQHSINDVIQAILCEKEGIDTINSDWMKTLPLMIEILQKEIAQETLEINTKGPFLELINALIKVIKKDGIIAMNHYMFQLDLDWGYPADLFEDMIPMTRKWLNDLTDCKEVFYDGFNRNWWIFLQKT